MGNGRDGRDEDRAEAAGDAATGAGGTSRRHFIGASAGAVGLMAAGPASAAPGDGDPIYRIHPAVGFARVGNAPYDSFFIGPEAPGHGPLGDAPGTTAPPYKQGGLVKPQGARFRVYEYDQVNGRLVPIREVTLGTPGVSRIEWNVHVANKKASFNESGQGPAGEGIPAPGLRNATVSDRASLDIDFGARRIAGALAAPVDIAPGGSGDPSAERCPRKADGSPVIGSLGQLRTDAAGRLIVIGGRGAAGYQGETPPELPHWANNDGWFDDVADGPVTATITVQVGGQTREVPVDVRGGAWVISGPPDFAPSVPATVSGYDLMVDLAVRSIPIPADSGLYDDGGPLAHVRRMKADFRAGQEDELPTTVPDYRRDIEPLLAVGYNLWFVNGLVTHRHNSLANSELADPSARAARLRNKVLANMRPPVGLRATGKGNMPKLLGDDPYVGSQPESVKRLPLTHVQWALLRRWAAGAFTPPSGSPPPATITPHGLDQAALENTSGGAFYPGMEYSWLIRNPAIWIEPFRLDPAATSTYWGEDGTPIGPGYFTRQMALPWHADFNDCRNEGGYGWWPSTRPTDVLPSLAETSRVEWARPTSTFEGGNRESTHEDMLHHWYKFGFVIDDGDLYYESERAPTIP